MISYVSVVVSGLAVGLNVLLHGEANPCENSAKHLASDPATQDSNSGQHAAE
jgi:hypothetical protein